MIVNSLGLKNRTRMGKDPVEKKWLILEVDKHGFFDLVISDSKSSEEIRDFLKLLKSFFRCG
jgi:hypothetical protein